MTTNNSTLLLDTRINREQALYPKSAHKLETVIITQTAAIYI